MTKNAYLQGTAISERRSLFKTQVTEGVNHILVVTRELAETMLDRTQATLKKVLKMKTRERMAMKPTCVNIAVPIHYKSYQMSIGC